MAASENFNATPRGSKLWPVIRGSWYVPWGAWDTLIKRQQFLFSHIHVKERWNKFINRTAVHHPSHFFASYFISPFLQHPSFYLLSAISSPLFFPICLQSVCTRRGFPFSLWGCCFFFSLLHLSFILFLYVFHAGKSSSSCMQQRVCSVWSCPIRDLTVWCYNPQPRGILSLSSSLTLILFSFPITDYFILFSYTYFLNLAPKPLRHSPELSLSP